MQWLICKWADLFSYYMFEMFTIGDDLTTEEIEDMIAETDTDGSGTVDYEGNFTIQAWPLKSF